MLLYIHSLYSSHFNLSFCALKSDTCNRCEALNTEGYERREVLTEQELHHQKAAAVKKGKDEDIAEAKVTETKKVLIFDLLRTSLTPSVSLIAVYNKCQMWTFNLGIYDAVAATGYMDIWSDSIASGGAHMTGSCLLQHIDNFKPPQVKHLIV
jgi:hypothetical protein